MTVKASRPLGEREKGAVSDSKIDYKIKVQAAEW